MHGLIVAGTDTGAGKTSFAMLWQAQFGDTFDYWKPLETGESDSGAVRRLVPGAVVHAPLLAFREAVAPMLAARRENTTVPSAAELASRCPMAPGRCGLIETFGSPFSPLNEGELQTALLTELNLPVVLVASASVGAIGRCLQSLNALEAIGIQPFSVAIVGDRDGFAVEQLERWWKAGAVWAIEPPLAWTPEGIAQAALANREALYGIHRLWEAQCKPAPSDLQARDRQSIWHPYTALDEIDPPLHVVRAQDEFLYLADGRVLIDAISSWWTILHGHRHPLLMAALAEAARQFDHIQFAGLTHQPAVELAELLLATMPWKGGRVFYSDDGSTAVEVALKMAHQFWRHQGERGRTRFIGFEGGYHGDTVGAMAVGRDPVFTGPFQQLLFESSIVPLSPEALEEELQRWAGQIAAVIVEPLVQGAGGMRMHSPQTLRELFAITRRHGVPFIADEVMTGGCRTGSLWAFQSAQIQPDLVCTGKTLAGGILPLAATLVSPAVIQAFRSADRSKAFFHGHSFTAHPLACAVAVANWRQLLPSASTAVMEAVWRGRLLPLASLPGVREVRIRGSVAAVELAAEGGYLAEAGGRMRRVCIEHGVLCRPLGNVLYTIAPLQTTLASLERIAQAMRAAVTAVC
jgi:adenosylmethionine---8-amino-7-oxononanoate aminotransferase